MDYLFGESVSWYAAVYTCRMICCKINTLSLHLEYSTCSCIFFVKNATVSKFMLIFFFLFISESL